MIYTSIQAPDFAVFDPETSAPVNSAELTLNLANPAWVDAEPDLKAHIVEVKLPASAKNLMPPLVLYQESAARKRRWRRR